MLFKILMSVCVGCVVCHEPSEEESMPLYDDDLSLDTAEIIDKKMHKIPKLQMLNGYNDTTKRPILEVIYGYNDTKTRKSEKSNTIENSDRYNQASRNYKKLMYEDKETLIDYPYSASVKRKGSHYATGALIDKRWVISVAAEFYYVRESIKLFRVVLGSVDCKRGGSVFPLKAIEIHPLFAPGSPAHDLALLRLAWPVVNTLLIKPIPLAVSQDGQLAYAKYLTTYWPRIVVNNTVLPANAPERVKSTSMRSSTQTLIPPRECARTLNRFHLRLGPGTLCLVPITRYHGKCMPDVGAPLVARGELWGVTSGWSPAGCGALPGASVRPAPALATRVDGAGVRRWLDTHLLP